MRTEEEEEEDFLAFEEDVDGAAAFFCLRFWTRFCFCLSF